MSQKVLVFGSNGLLGQAVKKQFSNALYFSLFTAAKSNATFCFDFTDDNKLFECFEICRPDIVINCAALVNLSLCEEEKLSAYLINARFVSQLAILCEQYKARLVHISTDHYYTGDGSKKHSEADKLVFLNEYSRTKFCAEQFALQYEKSLVLRTNIVGFRNSASPTFLEWAIDSIKKGDALNLFTDFYTSSIHVRQFAGIMQDFLTLEATGLYNAASCDVFSKKDFVLALSRKFFGYSPPFKNASVKSMRCKRAESLGLDSAKAEMLLGYKMPSMESVIQSIYEEYCGLK